MTGRIFEITDAEKARIIKAAEEDVPRRDMALRFGRSQKTIRKIVREHRQVRA